MISVKEETAEFRIVSGPEDVEASAGEAVSLHVKATGSGLSYQWQFRTSSGTAWRSCTSAGCNTDTFSFVMKESMDGRQYRCIVDDGRNVAVSRTARITYVSVLEITTQPEDTEAAAGETVSLHVGASGSDLSYQWQWRKSGSSWTNCTSSGCDTDTFRFEMKKIMDGREYRCVVSDGNREVISETALVTLADETLRITEQPENYMVAAGDSVDLHIGARGTDLCYQWQWRKSGGSWTNCTSAGCDTDTFSFVMKTTMDGRQYRCIVIDGEGNVVLSETVTVELVNRATVSAVETEPAEEAAAAAEAETAAEEVTADEAVTVEAVEVEEPVEAEGTEAVEETVEAKETEAAEETAEAEETEAAEETAEAEETEATEETAEAEPEEYTELTIVSQPWIVEQDGKSFVVTLEADGEELSYRWDYFSAAGSDWREILEGLDESVFVSVDGESRGKLTTVLTEAAESVMIRCIVSDSYGNEVTTNELELN